MIAKFQTRHWDQYFNVKVNRPREGVTGHAQQTSAREATSTSSPPTRLGHRRVDPSCLSLLSPNSSSDFLARLRIPRGRFTPLHKEPQAAKGCALMSEGSERFDPNLNNFRGSPRSTGMRRAPSHF